MVGILTGTKGKLMTTTSKNFNEKTIHFLQETPKGNGISFRLVRRSTDVKYLILKYSISVNYHVQNDWSTLHGRRNVNLTHALDSFLLGC